MSSSSNDAVGKPPTKTEFAKRLRLKIPGEGVTICAVSPKPMIVIDASVKAVPPKVPEAVDVSVYCT
jgi:hypothetical protein